MGTDVFISLNAVVNSSETILEQIKSTMDLLVATTSWVFQKNDEGLFYDFLSIVPEGQEKDEFINRKYSQDLDYLKKKAIKETIPEGITVSFLGNWLNPYVTNEEAYWTWASYLTVSSTSHSPGIYQINIRLHYVSKWFSLPHQTEQHFDDESRTRQLQDAGYTLNKGDYVSASKGQSYVPLKSKLERNRLAVLNGIISLIENLEPMALVLAYNRAKIDPENEEIYFDHKFWEGYPPLVYYGDPYSQKAIARHKAEGERYLVKIVDGIQVYLEESHFDFVQ